MHTRTILGAALVTMAAMGCASLPAGTPTADRQAGSVRGTNVVVLEGEQLRSSRGTLLSALRSRMAQMRVTGGSQCPQLELRGRTSIYGSSDPSVYLDGARAVNTCLLEQMSVSDLERVEIYPMGVTTRPGYRSNAGGLILVFSRTAAY
jgi:propanediol dehydratase large subunit